MFAPLETHVGWRNIQIAFGAAKESAMSSGGGGGEARIPSLLVPPVVSIRFIRRYRVSTVVRLLMNQTGRRATRVFGMCSAVRLTLRKLWEKLL